MVFDLLAMLWIGHCLALFLLLPFPLFEEINSGPANFLRNAVQGFSFRIGLFSNDHCEWCRLGPLASLLVYDLASRGLGCLGVLGVVLRDDRLRFVAYYLWLLRDNCTGCVLSFSVWIVVVFRLYR